MYLMTNTERHWRNFYWEKTVRMSLIAAYRYRVYFAEFRRKSRLTMGVLPGLACASILNTNSSCPSWLSWLIR
jgi:hypothetical protein